MGTKTLITLGEYDQATGDAREYRDPSLLGIGWLLRAYELPTARMLPGPSGGFRLSETGATEVTAAWVAGSADTAGRASVCMHKLRRALERSGWAVTIQPGGRAVTITAPDRTEA